MSRPVDGLDGTGKVVYGPDLSLESQAPDLSNLDTNGHGTFMAGLIAAQRRAPRRTGPASAYRGRPDREHQGRRRRRRDGRLPGDRRDRLGRPASPRRRPEHPGPQPLVRDELGPGLQVDPLAYAAEQAWKEGIVVVAAAGNYGFQSHMNNAPALADPAIDAYLIAVGSSDSEGTMTIADDSAGSLNAPKRTW